MIETRAIVLHAFDYRETSRIVRLATRDAGVIAAIARGARRPRSRFGQGLDLFTSGSAQVALHGTGDLHTLASFEATDSRVGLASSLRHFGAAAALGELCLRFGTEATPGVHDALESGLDELARAGAGLVSGLALAAAWRIVAELGFAPALDDCALCHRPIDEHEEVRFSHRAGGAVCVGCRSLAPGARALPAEARSTLRSWLDGNAVPIADRATERAHQRLLREFLEEHLADGKALGAFQSWERLEP
ncbi:MAG: DNA repair protein RecO [Gemmatimonadaceae bacterium]|nr:DNA repair protein RecO [Gemmatimonadaceae bacterium]